ncbi:MAG: hypothetical protein DMD67_19200 [Gemmatimonadetes bacterium]|nr:MAG: hypothetical protein DMD67_19200 [Gemmatimonadota bacterium]
MSLVTGAATPEVSILVPAKDEAENLPEFVRQAREALLPLPYTCEIVVIDDGSHDGTAETLRDLSAKHPFVRVVTHRSQRGIADALASGADAARGRVLVFYPADLQYRPSDIPGLVQPILDDSADIVTGTIRRAGHRLELGQSLSAGGHGRPHHAPGLASLHGGHRGDAGLPRRRAPRSGRATACRQVEVRHRPYPRRSARSHVGVVSAAIRPQADAVLWRPRCHPHLPRFPGGCLRADRALRASPGQSGVSIPRAAPRARGSDPVRLRLRGRDARGYAGRGPGAAARDGSDTQPRLRRRYRAGLALSVPHEPHTVIEPVHALVPQLGEHFLRQRGFGEHGVPSLHRAEGRAT